MKEKNYYQFAGVLVTKKLNVMGAKTNDMNLNKNARPFQKTAGRTNQFFILSFSSKNNNQLTKWMSRKLLSRRTKPPSVVIEK